MILNFSYDSSVASAPVGFTAALDQVASFFETNFHDPVTVNIAVGYGELNGQPLTVGAAASISYLSPFTYAQVKSALAANATSSTDLSAVASLPANDPTGGAYWVTTAEMKALNLGTHNGLDGYIGFKSAPGAFDYDNSDGVTAGQDDFFAVAAHEISEVMGRILLTGAIIAGRPPGYTPLDLFHFSGAGTRIFAGDQTGYFSVDNGATNLRNFNTVSGGDYGDWASSGGHDAFNASISAGVIYPISETDMQAMDTIGWDRVPVPDLNITNFIAGASSVSFTVNNIGLAAAGATVTGIYLSTDTNITPADMPIGAASTPALAQGASDSEGAAIALPANLAAGTYYIGAYADSTGTVLEGNEANNSSTALAIVLGNDGDNSLAGTSKADTLIGFGGNDTLSGGAGKDIMIGGTGDDLYVVDSTGDVVTENPGEGIDTVRASVSYVLAATLENLSLTGIGNINATGNSAANALTGNDGNNILTGLAGADTLDGGGGSDTVTYAASSAAVNVSLMTAYAAGGHAQGDVLLNIESLTGSIYNDTIEGNGGDNVLNGNNGVDTASYAHATAGVTVDLTLTAAQNTGGAGVDTISKFENLTGSSYGDTLGGTTTSNVLSGGDGNDSLSSGAGIDTLDGGTGQDTMAGGDGNDVYIVDDSGDSIIETATGGADTVRVTLASYTLPDNVEILAYSGSGSFNGSGNDLANTVTGGAGADTLDGGNANDQILGADGNDQLLGGNGNDWLTGGLGADTLTGGAGADRFLFGNVAEFASAAGRDAIADFSHAEADKIDLSGIDANTALTGNQAFTFIAAQAFHNIAGELHYASNALGGITVSGDVNGDGSADFGLDVNVTSLVATDFIL